MNTLSLLLIVSQPIKSIRSFCIKHAQFIHSALKQLSKVFSPTDAVFPFQGEGTLFFGLVHPTLKIALPQRQKAYSAAQIISSKHNSASISKGTLVNYSETSESKHVRRRWTQKEQRQRPIWERLDGFHSGTGQNTTTRTSGWSGASSPRAKPISRGPDGWNGIPFRSFDA